MPDHSWKCEKCRSNNPAFTTVCRDCGHPFEIESPPSMREPIITPAGSPRRDKACASADSSDEPADFLSRYVHRSGSLIEIQSDEKPSSWTAAMGWGIVVPVALFSFLAPFMGFYLLYLLILGWVAIYWGSKGGGVAKSIIDLERRTITQHFHPNAYSTSMPPQQQSLRLYSFICLEVNRQTSKSLGSISISLTGGNGSITLLTLWKDYLPAMANLESLSKFVRELAAIGHWRVIDGSIDPTKPGMSASVLSDEERKSIEAASERAEKKARWVYVAIVAVITGVIFIPVMGSMMWQNSVAHSCDGREGSPSSKTMSGTLSAHAKLKYTFYVSNGKSDELVFRCSGKRCNYKLSNRLDTLVGKPARAEFCGGEMLWLEVAGERLITKDHSSATPFNAALIGLAMFAVFAMLILFEEKLFKKKNGHATP